MVNDIDAGNQIERVICVGHPFTLTAGVVDSAAKSIDVSLQIGIWQLDVETRQGVQSVDLAGLTGEMSGQEAESEAPDADFQRASHWRSDVPVEWAGDLAVFDQLVEETGDVGGVFDPVVELVLLSLLKRCVGDAHDGLGLRQVAQGPRPVFKTRVGVTREKLPNSRDGSVSGSW